MVWTDVGRVWKIRSSAFGLESAKISRIGKRMANFSRSREILSSSSNSVSLVELESGGSAGWWDGGMTQKEVEVELVEELFLGSLMNTNRNSRRPLIPVSFVKEYS